MFSVLQVESKAESVVGFQVFCSLLRNKRIKQNKIKANEKRTDADTSGMSTKNVPQNRRCRKEDLFLKTFLTLMSANKHSRIIIVAEKMKVRFFFL